MLRYTIRTTPPRFGRRTGIAKTETYAYDFCDQFVAGQGFTYAYDDIGNRTVAEGRAYAANALNQYTAIDAFEPEYDADGNQTKVLTATGEWAVEYNAENRSIRWTQGNTVVTMGYDRLGRRVFHKEMSGNRQITYTKFLYNGYLCVQQLFSNSPWNVYKEFIWDPTEPVATRPLCFRQNAQRSTFLLHDGNKNVTDVVTVGPFNEPVAHYDYAPFGAVAATGPRAADNPFRFSSEFHDDALALVYYNYRHYNPLDGRWTSRDSLEENGGVHLYCFIANASVGRYDYLGLICCKLDPIVVSVSTEGAAYLGLGADFLLDLSITTSQCCCDGEWEEVPAIDITGKMVLEVGIGFGGKVSVPFVGSGSLMGKGPQYVSSHAIDFSTGCGESGMSGSIDFVDMQGRLGISGSGGLGIIVGGGVSWDYGIRVSLVFDATGVHMLGKYGAKRSGSLGATINGVGVSAPFGDEDYTNTLFDIPVSTNQE